VHGLAQAEQRMGVPAPGEEEEKEQDDAKGIAQREAHAAPESNALRGNVRQHGVAENG
jgi:hypothetical protein